MINRRTALALTVLGALVILSAAGWIAMRSMMRPTDTTADELEAIPPGERVEVIGQITAIQDSSLTVEVLEGNGYDVFDQRTGRFLTVERTGSEEIVMGAEANVFEGAIVQFEGVKTGPNAVRLDRIVILTGFVTGPEE